MTDKFTWYKATLDFLKGNKIVLLLVTAALSGTAGYNLPELFTTKPVEVTVEVPKDDKALITRINKLEKRVSNLERWH